MTPESLLDKLELIEKIDAKIIGKLRRQLANPEKNVTVKKILNFLVKHDMLTKEEVEELRKSKPSSSATGELMAGVRGSSMVHSEVAEFDEPQADSGNISPVNFDVPEFDQDDQATIIADPEQLMPTATPDPTLAQPMATWEDEFPDNTGQRRFSFDGKIDSKDQWATRWVYIGFGTLGLLLVAGFLLFAVLSLISAEDRFEAANQSFENGTYGDAIKKFEDFLDKHRSHEKAPLAKVKLAHAMIADSYKRKLWEETIVRSENQLPPLVEDDDIDLDEIRPDLAVMLPTSVLNLAKRATKQEATPELIKQLEIAKDAKTLVDNPVYIPNSKRKQANIAKLLDQVDEEIAKGEGLIRKQGDKDNAISEIKVAREGGQTEKAHSIFNELIRSYGDLRVDPQLQDEMRQVSQMESQLVKPVEAQPGIANSSRPSPIESSVILASKTGTPIGSLTGEVLPVLADGSVYGIDLGSGGVLWRRFVGYQTSVQPENVGAQNVLIGDQFNHDLLMVNAANGNLIWRTEIGESFLQPQIDETGILLTCDSGNLYRINPESGEAIVGVKIPQTANVTMSKSGRNGKIYQPGFYSNLYVLSSQDFTCEDVYYLGHYRGSIAVEPVIWNGYVLVAVNKSGVCDLHILKSDEETGRLVLAQRINRVTRGIVTNPLIRFGRFMLINSESGDLKILELNKANEDNPVRILEEEKFENRDGRRTHVATAGSQLWIGSRGIMRYKVSRSLGTFDRQVISNPDDYFIGPIRKYGNSIVHIRKRSGSALTSISAVDSETLKPIWRTDLGGPLAGPPIVLGNQIMAISSQGDLFAFANGADDQVAGDEVKSSNILEDLLFDETISLSESASVCLGPPGRPQILYVDAANGTSKLIRLPGPAKDAACRTIVVDGDLVVPSKQGSIMRVDPTNGKIVGTPFLPAVNPGDNVSWRQPASIGNSQFVVGAGSDLYLIDASNRRVLSRAGELKVQGDLKLPLVAIGEIVYGVYNNTGTSKEKLIAINAGSNKLEEVGSMDLTSLAAAGPWTAGDTVLVRMDNNQVLGFDRQLNQKWAADIGTGSLAAKPQFENSTIQLYFNDGRLLTVNSESGEVESEFNLGQPIAHQPVFINGRAVFAGLDGTLHSVPASQ